MPSGEENVPHVVIVGAGFAGLTAARHLERTARDRPLRVTLVDQHNYHTFQPLLYQVATAGLQPHDIGHSVRGIFGRRRLRSRRSPIDVRMGTVTAIDRAERSVRLEDGGTIPYDVLIVAAGATTNDYGIPGVREHGFPLKALPESLALRNHLLAQYERASTNPEEIAAGALTVVIAGGGPTGVELAGALTELHHVLRRDHPRLRLERARVVLVEMLDDVLPPYSRRMRAYARRALEARGVEVRTGTAIERVERDRVLLADGDAIPTRTLVWTAGVKAHPLAATLGAEQARAGRVVVDPDLRLPDDPAVFVIGDIAAATGDDGEPLPQLAPVAIQQGKHVAQQVPALLRGERLAPFRYRDKGTMATIGRHDAVVELPLGIRFGGVLAWLAWLFLHLMELVGFRNRVAVFLNWLWNYATYDRAARLIIAPRRLEEPHPPAEASDEAV